MQELATLIGNSPATAALDGRALPFPQLSFFQTHPTHPDVVAAARQLGMAVMQCVYYGHNTPGRPFSHISSLLHPSHLPEVCPFSHCKVDGCKGNHIERSADGSRFTLHVPHSKTSASMVGPISYPFSGSLVPWLEAWLMFGWLIVAKQVGWPALLLAGWLGVAVRWWRRYRQVLIVVPPSLPPPLPLAGHYHCLLHPGHWSCHQPQQAHLPLQGWYCLAAVRRRAPARPPGSSCRPLLLLALILCPPFLPSLPLPSFLYAGVAGSAAQAGQAHLCA